MPPDISDPEVAEQWDRNADVWTEQVRKRFDIFRELWNNPAFLEFAGDLSGKTVLDAGCGEGHNTRTFARRGARMTGVDLSRRMIELAREEEVREPLGIRYQQASFSGMPSFANESFDAAVSTMALMDGPDFAGAMREIARVLKPGGTLTYSILHPCFATKGMGWIKDESGRAIKFTVADYFNDEAWIERWKFGHAPNASEVEEFGVPRFDRMLADYINPTIAGGLVLEEIREPRAPESACVAHPEAFQKFRDHIPLFLYVRASKPQR
jgi:ubiquinone/menaquinone biosynthesis C-methylase UbiE